ncbi:tetratricopeptide repeat protein [Streptomyces chryseus]|uniref:tetratricopeptide repeat protein n=1 Tax=Streptomyces chryseus TaxID=68186 RepID=UPI001E519FFF|nr:tetratricopeptide repeat protein [Streptomyces chryseus]
MNVEVSGVVQRCVKVHGVVLDSVAAAVPEVQRSLLVTSAARLLDDEVPETVIHGQAANRVRDLIPHVMKLLQRVTNAGTAGAVADTATRLAGHVFESGDYQAALHLSRAVTEVVEHWLGPDDPATYRAQHRAAMALFRLGSFEESETLHRSVLNGRRRVLGWENLETLQSQQDIHEPLGQLRKFDACIAALRETEAARANVQGDLHPDTLYARALLIEYLAEVNAVEDFDRVSQETVAVCHENLGAASFVTVTARHNLAYGLYRFGRWEQAEPAARVALEGRESLQGAGHPLALSAAVLLSWVLRERGLLQESISLGRRVVAEQERTLGPEHPYLLANRTGLASSLAAAGDTDGATELARSNLPLCERVLGFNDAVTVETRGLLG